MNISIGGVFLSGTARRTFFHKIPFHKQVGADRKRNGSMWQWRQKFICEIHNLKYLNIRKENGINSFLIKRELKSFKGFK